MSTPFLRRLGPVLGFVCALEGCGRVPSGDRRDPPAPEVTRPAVAAASANSSSNVVLDLLAGLLRCDVDHGGALFDLGSDAVDGLLGNWSLSPDLGLSDIEHDGATWARVSSKSLQIRFVIDEPSPLFIAARVRGGASRSGTWLLDGRPLGAIALPRGQIKVVATHGTGGSVPAGAHTLGVRFSGAPRGQTEPLSEIDWIHVAPLEETLTNYAAPTMEELVTDSALGSVPHRSVALRAPALVRCAAWLPPRASLRAAIGFHGVGEGDAEIRILQDGETPASLRVEHVVGGNRASWTNVEVPLDPWRGKVVSIELRARAGTPGGRLLFGDPVVIVPPLPPKPLPEARLALVLVASGIDRLRLPPRATEGSLPNLAELERTSVDFEHHRGPTTVTAGVVASLLTGVPPRVHQVQDPGARLPAALTTIATAARDGSVQTAMFSGCPSTSNTFGFARGWDKYVEYSPVEGVAATAPIADATSWIAEHLRTPGSRALVVVHARGGHPPWDVTPAEANKLLPIDYSGPMEPRRGAQVIARARGKRTRYRLNENDRTRMWAIYDAALAGHDRALGGLLEMLRKEGLWDQTLLVVTGDVNVNGQGRAPFGDAEDLSEDALALPLWVRFPGGALAGTKVDAPTIVTDIPRTVLDSLKLGIPDGFDGFDLFARARGEVIPGGRPLSATLGARFASRWGDLLLSGSPGRQPTLCDLSTDPACETDRLEAMPLAARALWRFTYDVEVDSLRRRRGTREPATVDAPTAAALQVWGE